MTALAVFALAALLAIVAPGLATVLCGGILAAQASLSLLRNAVRRPARRVDQAASGDRPWFSIHVATHDEPPAVVMSTLDHLARMAFDRARFEVIVLDNNTADPALWMPVRAHCARLGAGFRFRHAMGVEGAKAGALNLALAMTDARASHVVTVDADYRVTPDFLSEAEGALRRTGADYVQFPQAYRRPAHIARGVDIELEDYFRVEAAMADGAEAVLLTGTLCVISRRALASVGGWSGRTATEDAELGVRLCEAGYTGRFVARVVGQGLLPLGFRDLASQRARWSGGNLRTLACHAASLARLGRRFGPRKAGAVAAQLGAWLNFCLVPAACLVAARVGQGSHALATVASLSVVLGFADIVARLAERGLRDGLGARAVASAIASRVALAPAAAMATVDAMLPGRQAFVVTAKAATPHLRAPVAILPHAVLFALALHAARQPSLGVLPDLALLLLMVPLPAALLTGIELARYRRFVADAVPAAGAPS